MSTDGVKGRANTNEVIKLKVPISKSLSNELISFWKEIFGADDDLEGSVVLMGKDIDHNQDAIYIRRSSDRISGTCRLIVPNSMLQLGGFAEVATDPKFRRAGIATSLCGEAVKDFKSGLGKALFLGTGNPEAARIYHRLGWRKLPGANVMALITNGDSPEKFLVDYFRDTRSISISKGDPSHRIPIIPLIIAPHDWILMDVNAGIFSTRYVIQGGCMSLYPRYTALTKGGKGEWFSAISADGRVVGISTVTLNQSGECQVDGFFHFDHQGGWSELIEAAANWGISNGAVIQSSWVLIEDEDKIALFESIGFDKTDSYGKIEVNGRKINTIKLVRK